MLYNWATGTFIYSPSCRSKHVWTSFFSLNIQKNILKTQKTQTWLGCHFSTQTLVRRSKQYSKKKKVEHLLSAHSPHLPLRPFAWPQLRMLIEQSRPRLWGGWERHPYCYSYTWPGGHCHAVLKQPGSQESIINQPNQRWARWCGLALLTLVLDQLDEPERWRASGHSCTSGWGWAEKQVRESGSLSTTVL